MLDATSYFEHWSGVFEESALEDIKLPSTLTRIRKGTFKNYKHLKGIVLPEKLDWLEDSCFCGAGL